MLVSAVLGGRTVPEPNAYALPAERQIKLSGASGAVARPGNALGFWHVDGPMGQLNPERCVFRNMGSTVD